MKQNKRITDRRQAKSNSFPWRGPERRGTGRPWVADMLMAALEPRLLYTGVTDTNPVDLDPDTDMPCVFDQAATDATIEQQVAAASGAKIPVAGGVPILHSNPSATAKLIIDFDGDAARMWGSYSVPATPAYDQDGDATTFNTAELASINEIWARVAEKYSPFNIDVTTEDTGNYANKVAVKVIVGGSGSWLGSLAGGISFIGSFYNMTDNISYVFPANLANGTPKYTAEAVAHEAGHAFGLQHQGQYNGTTLVQEYNPGNSQIAPIMGNSYYAARGLWWLGTPSNNASATQDDLSVISNTYNFFGYRADDYGNTMSTATSLSLSNNTFTAAGVIEKNTDLDFFSFSTPTGTLTLNLAVAPYGAMLDGSLFVYNSSGTLIASADTTSLGESLTLNLSAGSYYVSVGSHGGYGDIGQYTLTGSVAPAQDPTPPPVVVSDPTGLTVTPVSAGEILLSWVDSAGDETGFVIQRSTDNGSTWTTLATTGTTLTSYHDTTVFGGVTYQYRVQAVNGQTTSNFTAGVSGTTVPTAPTGVTATPNSTSQITLTWSDVTGETSYTIERSTDGSTWTQIGTTGANVTTFVSSGLAGGTQYYYRVRALDATGPSAYSSYATGLTVPTTPGTIAATGNSTTQIGLTWAGVTGATSYAVERSTNGANGWTQIGTTGANVTAYTDGSLAAGTQYYYRVRALNASGASGYTTVASALTIPVAPAAPLVTVVSATQATITWAAVTGATSYVLERSADGSSWSTLTTTGTTTVSDMTLAAGSRYYYRVRAVNGSGGSDAGLATTILTLPAAPVSIGATGSSASKVTVIWSAVSGAGSYDVERSADGLTGWAVVGPGVVNTTFIDEGLTAQTHYYYRVRATNTSGVSDYTTVADATTLAVPVVVTPPTLLTATPTGANSVTVGWQDNSDNEDGFVLQRSADNGATWATIITTDPGVNSYQDTGLAAGTTYVYRAWAYSGAVTSDLTATASALTFPAAPGTPVLGVASATRVNVSWAAADGATSYQVERSANGTSGWATVGSVGGDTTSFADLAATAGTRFYYRVRAFNASGGSDYTAVASALTLPAAPASVSVSVPGPGKLSVSWTAVASATGYQLQRSADGNSGWVTVATTTGNVTSFAEQGLSPSTRYYYRVRAVNGSGASEYAAAASGLTVPATPSAPNTAAVSPTQIGLTWTGVPGATSYQLERSADGSTWSSLTVVYGTTTNFTDSDLAADTRYYYRVRAVNASGTSDVSGSVAGNTLQSVPAAPALLAVTSLSTTSVALTWADLSTNESGFKVEYSTDGKKWQLAGNVAADQTGTQITNLAVNKLYYFRVTAYNEMGYSTTSNTATGKTLAKGNKPGQTSDNPAPSTALNVRKVSATLPGLSKDLAPDAPLDLRATPYSTSAAQLTWTDASDSELGFRVEYSLNGRTWVTAGYVEANQTGCRVTGLKKGKHYVFRVSAYNLAGYSARSATANAIIPSVLPRGSTAMASVDADQDTTLDVRKVKNVMPGLPANLKVA